MSLLGLLARFGLGVGVGLLAAFAAFGGAILRPGEPAFEAVMLSVVAAAILALVRSARIAEAAVIAAGYGLLRFGLGGWKAGIAGVLIAVGAWVVAVVFDELGRAGVRLGKFLVMGPLLGGVCLAVAPLTMPATSADTFRPLILQLFLGIVIGDGVGLGVELAELLPWAAPAATPTARPASVETPPPGALGL